LRNAIERPCFPYASKECLFDYREHTLRVDLLRKIGGDFSGWDKDAAKYEKAFDKLLKGLQAG